MKKEPAPKQEPKREMQYREASFEIRADEAGVESVRMSVSSEAPVLSYVDFDGQWMRAWEILDHAEGSIDMSRCKDGLVILDQHGGDQIGLMAVSIEGRKLGGAVEFCTGARAQEIKQDAVKKLRRNTSVGYRVNADSYRMEGNKDGIPVVRATSWMPYEASFVPVPADPGVGVGRAENQTIENRNQTTAAQPAKEKKTMTPKEIAALFARAAKYGIDTAKVETLVEGDNARAALDVLIVEKQEADAEKARKEISDLQSRKPDRPANVVDPVASIDQRGAPAIVGGKPREYSVMNVIRSMSGIHADIGFEREISQELERQRGTAAKGIIIPHAALAKREFTVTGTSSASVATNLLSGEFIDLLRTKSILGAAGVRFLTGLTGNIAIPKMSAGCTGYWVSESADVTASAPTLGQVSGSPHTCGVLTDISRRLILQSSPAAEMLVRDEIIERIIRTIQVAVFAGTGADGQPSAITTATGINNPAVTQGTPTYSELLGFPGAIMADNAEATNQAWIGTAEVWAKLAATATNGTGSPLALDPSTDMLLGRKFYSTEDVPANSLWFGNWSSVVVGVWGNGLDINVDDKTLSSSGGIRIVGLQDVDVMVRQGMALAYNAAVTS